MGNINGKALPDEQKPDIIYVFDALCGWCYGFSPVIHKVYDSFSAQVDFQVLSGGMITGDRIGPIGEVAPYIKQAYKTVEASTGVKFGEKFLVNILDKGEVIFSSIPPAKALSVFRQLQPDNTLAFATEMQNAIYFYGIDVSDLGEYGKIASVFGIDADVFIQKMQQPDLEQLIINEFQMAASFGVMVYPSIVLIKGEETSIISEGYKSYEDMVVIIEESLK